MFRKQEIKVWTNEMETRVLLTVLEFLKVKEIRVQKVGGLRVTAFITRKKDAKKIINKINKNVSVFRYEC